MHINLYIHSAAAISPQNTFDSNNWKNELIIYNNNKLTVVEPDYSAYINPVAIRRMGRVVKMGIAAGMKALQLAKLETPSAIITGTGRGSMSNTQSFVKDLIQMQEEALLPTHFIQSTYNNINGWLALQSKSKTYNQTFVHRGSSFEWTLIDARLFFKDNPEEQTPLLAGSFDEFTEEYYTVRKHVHFWKEQPISNQQLFNQCDSEGTIAGEGATFFTLHHKASEGTVLIENLQIANPNKAQAISEALESFIKETGFVAQSGDVFLNGMNGDSRFDGVYNKVRQALNITHEFAYKHLCGSYDTATAFGLFVAKAMLNDQKIPETLHLIKGDWVNEINRVILVNTYKDKDFSMILLSKK